MTVNVIKQEQTAGDYSVDNGLVRVTANLESGLVTIRWSGGEAMKELYAEARYGTEQLRTTYYREHAVREASFRQLEDGFGRGVSWSFEHEEPGKPALRQRFRMYESQPYVLVELEAAQDAEWETNELTPIASYLNDGGVLEFGAGAGEDVRALFVPFDNDKWVRYASHAIPCSVHSYEATAVYRAGSRNGFVLGSVTHDVWKTGLVVEGTFAETVGRLRVYGGAADLQTRDTVPHGAVRGKTLLSPTLFVGAFADYRDGLEAYGQANAALTPALKWEGGVPMGWNSWSAVMSKLDFDVYAHTSDFFAKELQHSGFADDEGSLYVNFDAFSDNLTKEELQEAVRRVKANGQKPGTYYTPFAFWGSDPDTPVEGTDGTVRYRDILLKDRSGNPLPRLDGALPIDPTHPEALARIKRKVDAVVEAGYDYLKMDFLTHGAMEGVRYDPNARTGIQAYNAGMAFIRDLLDPARIGRPFLINLSIAPLFPHGYAHSRRVSCDAFGLIGDTEYMLNALTYGWWINDNLYRFNDPDHIVLYKSDNQRATTEQEGRSRLNSGVIAGTSLLLGDDYRMEEAAKRAKAWMTNKEVIALARRGRTFRPAEGRSGAKGEDLFVLTGEDGTWIAAFNFDGDNGKAMTLSFDRLGIDTSSALVVRDLWSGSENAIPAGAGEHSIALEASESKLLLFRRQ
ncbi:alpha-galactosidase [Paenibacillus arenilitoris]|uniref:Alpha-galactosidase n=1 Tax=Paenibacillus arenilitoris TaxID=2772299 RepID=A0A927CIA5_9BACL|nr:alpha-galactosidase [Paenibacillus arenilitoris]MBD2868005.1 alpha-galactosidase [Paenibacillus arenilitoris]